MLYTTLILNAFLHSQAVVNPKPIPVLCLTIPGNEKQVRAQFIDEKKLKVMVEDTHKYFLHTVGNDAVLVDRQAVDLPMLQNKKALLQSVVAELNKARQVSDLTPEGAEAAKRFISDITPISNTEKLKPDQVPNNSQFAFSSMITINTNREVEPGPHTNGKFFRASLPMPEDERKRVQNNPLELPKFPFPSNAEQREIEERNNQYELNGGPNGIVAVWKSKELKPTLSFVSKSIEALAEIEEAQKKEISDLAQKVLRELATQMGIPESELSSPPDGQNLASAPQ